MPRRDAAVLLNVTSPRKKKVTVMVPVPNNLPTMAVDEGRSRVLVYKYSLLLLSSGFPWKNAPLSERT